MHRKNRPRIKQEKPPLSLQGCRKQSIIPPTARAKSRFNS
jgi:hypothetical protein